MKTRGTIKRFGGVFIALLLAMGLLGGAVPVAAQGNGAPDFVEVLVGGPGAAAAVDNANGRVTHRFTNFSVVLAELPEPALRGLSRDPGVNFVEPNGKMWAIGQTTPWGISRVGALDAWATATGSGIRLAILDTGIDGAHVDLAANVAADGINTIDATPYLSDGHGHGTHVAGTAGAVNNTIGVVGVAPNVTLVAVKVLNDSGGGTWASVAAGIDWSISNNIQVINMSLGGGDSTTMRLAVESAWNSGLLLVAAAGNEGNPAGRGENVSYPAAYAQVIAVAASDNKDKRASFSSTGPQVELIAPGVGIYSTFPGDSYKTWQGTSMAAPHVAGAAALVWSANKAISNAELRQLLRDTAEDLGLPANHQGYGLVRADRAVATVEPVATGNIEGRVTDGQNPIAGATVAVEGTGLSTTTASDGYYKVTNVSVGTYDVTASVDGYYSKTESVTIVEGDTVFQDFDLQAIPTYKVSGMVTSGGEALEGATVTIGETGQSATTDSLGNYEILDVKEGTYNITASKSGYTSQTETVIVDGDTTINFALEEATVATAVRVESITYATRGGGNHLDITVLLRDNLENPVTGASVSIDVYRDGATIWSPTGTTGSNGTITFTILRHQPGTYATAVTAVGAEGLEWDGVTPDNGYTK